MIELFSKLAQVVNHNRDRASTSNKVIWIHLIGQSALQTYFDWNWNILRIHSV